MRLERIYHPYWDWEEIDSNMWGVVENRARYLKLAIEFTGNHKTYGRFMRKVAEKWRFSCENALTDRTINRKAWIGHAACAMALGCPEDITREAWKELSCEQQLLANKEAERAIQAWEYSYIKNNGLCVEMGGEVLF